MGSGDYNDNNGAKNIIDSDKTGDSSSEPHDYLGNMS